MRIALVSRQLATDPHSGIVRATLDLAGALAAQGHRVELVTQGSAALEGRLPEGAGAHDVGGSPAALPSLAHAAAVHRTLADLHDGESLDAVLAPLWGGEAAVSVLDRRFPTIVSCMTSSLTLARINPKWAAQEYARAGMCLERAAVSRARHLHGLTLAALEDALTDYGGTPATRAVVPRGLRDRTGDAAHADARAGGPVRLLFVGRLEHRKGVDVLLDAVAALIAEGCDVELILAGPDSHATATGATYREAFVPRAATVLGLADRIRFEGAVSDERLHELYAATDVVCQPSRYESHGIVLVEAMMFAKPIVTSSGGGITAVVERDGNALLAEPGDAPSLAGLLREVIGSVALRARLGSRSRELYLERYEAGVVAGRMVDLFADAAAEHARRPPGAPFAERLAELAEEVGGPLEPPSPEPPRSPAAGGAPRWRRWWARGWG